MCGTVAVMAKDDSPDAPALRGLEAWAAFPADRDPRPVVLLDMIPPVYLASSPVGQARLALLHGAVEAVPGFPAAVLEAVCGQPGEYAGPPLEGVRGQPDDYAGPPLLLTGAVLGSFRYETDRGPRYLPAWDVRVEGISPIKVLDPAVIASGQVWEPAGRRRNENLRPTVTVGADDRTLTMTYNGSGTPPATSLRPAPWSRATPPRSYSPRSSHSPRTASPAEEASTRASTSAAPVRSPRSSPAPWETGCSLTPRDGRSSSHPNTKLENSKGIRDGFGWASWARAKARCAHRGRRVPSR
jgi:hypothetical protein